MLGYRYNLKIYFTVLNNVAAQRLRRWTQSLRELAELYVRIRADWLSQRRSESPRSRHLLHFGQLTKGCGFVSLAVFTFTRGKIKFLKSSIFIYLICRETRKRKDNLLYESYSGNSKILRELTDIKVY